jgi:hypothetical protein
LRNGETHGERWFFYGAFLRRYFLPLSFNFFVRDEKENPGAIGRSGVLLGLVPEA